MGQLRGVRSVGQGRLLTTTAIAALLCLAGPALAQSPTGGNVVAGSAAISQAGNATNIHQSTNKAIIDWQGFSVGAQNSVNFYQPGASSVTLNRVIGNEASVINGAINANGQVFIVNSAGVLFGKGSQVNVGGLVASTHDISNKDFMAGNYTFSGTSNAAVINQGRIRAHGGGYVALLGKTVSNEGVISARLGTVAMSAGEKLTLNFEGNSLLDVTIDKGALNALVENKRAIIADGGRVILTARAADQVLAAQVNNTGIVQARTIAALKGGSDATGRKGRRTAPKTSPAPDADPADVPMAQGNIKIYAYGGTANIAGKLDASAPKGGDGGFIETSGERVQIADGTIIATNAVAGRGGTWLIDPTDFNIVAGSGAQTASGIGATTLSDNLDATNGTITLTTASGGTGNGDINVNAAVTWGSDATLALNAANNININAPITINGAAGKLAMTFGHDYNIRTPASYAGAVLDTNGIPVAQVDPHALANGGDGVYGSIKFTTCVDTASCGTRLKINSVDYNLVGSMAQIVALNNQFGNFALAHDLDASGTTYTKAIVAILGAASQNTVFTGLGHTVSNLTISNATTNYTGLFGQGRGVLVLRDIGILNAAITAPVRNYVGALIGGPQGTLGGSVSVLNAYSTGSVTGNNNVGGLVGSAHLINYAYSSATVSGGQFVGGLVGSISGYTDVNVIPVGSGFTFYSTLAHVHATGSVTASVGTGGGLAGQSTENLVDLAYATGAVAGASTLGGLLGGLGVTGEVVNPTVRNSFATGNVTGGGYLGGLIGNTGPGGYASLNLLGRTIIIDNVYAYGDVTGSGGPVGGLLGAISMGAWNVATYPNAPTFSISNAHASGNVTVSGSAQSYVGGLVGQTDGSRYAFSAQHPDSSDICCGYAGTISNSTASGNVDASGVNNFAHVGGLIGGTRQTTITGSSATGNVAGSATFNQGAGGTVGGLVGYGETTSLANSYSTGALSGITQRMGGLVGSGGPLIISADTYYNTANAANGYGDQAAKANYDATDNSRGLSGDQVKDMAYYANGTINQVLAAREATAAQAAFQAEGVRTGSAIGSGPDVSSSFAPLAASIKAMQQTAKLDEIADDLKQTEQKVKDDDERRKRERKAASARANRGNAGGSGAGYGATIRSIDVDGQRFNLDGNKPSAPGGAQ